MKFYKLKNFGSNEESILMVNSNDEFELVKLSLDNIFLHTKYHSDELICLYSLEKNYEFKITNSYFKKQFEEIV